MKPINELLPTAMQELSMQDLPNPMQALNGTEIRQPFRISQELIEKHFDHFDTLRDTVLIKAKNSAMRFCSDMAGGTVPARWITLLGNSGTGKTFLARKITAFFRKYLDGLPDERSAQDERWLRRGGMKEWNEVVGDMVNGDYSGLRNLKEDWFVCLDDVGAEYGKHRELAITKLYEILTKRVGRFTVITTNKSLAEIAEMDVRISSRLLRDRASLVDASTTDYNMRKR